MRAHDRPAILEVFPARSSSPRSHTGSLDTPSGSGSWVLTIQWSGRNHSRPDHAFAVAGPFSNVQRLSPGDIGTESRISATEPEPVGRPASMTTVAQASKTVAANPSMTACAILRMIWLTTHELGCPHRVSMSDRLGSIVRSALWAHSAGLRITAALAPPRATVPRSAAGGNDLAAPGERHSGYERDC